MGSDDASETISAEPNTFREVGGEGDDVETIIDSVLRRDGPRMKFVRDIDTGGMGRIDVVRDRLLQRDMARKVLRSELAQDARIVRHFLREAQITAQLDHPAIVPVHDLRCVDGELEFTMKLVRGRTLTDRIGALPEGAIRPEMLGELVSVMLRICDALALAHAKGVLHCDIKPDNIMLGDWGEVYLMDWGIARPCEPSTDPGAPERIRISVAGSSSAEVDGSTQISGTPGYMAPEQVTGAPLDPRTDVFALGAVLYEIVTRHPPYEAGSMVEILLMVEEAQVVPPSQAYPDAGVPRALEEIIMKALAKEPDDRYASIKDMRAALQRFVLGSTEFRRMRVRRGQHVVREGEPGDSAFIVERGTLRVYKSVRGKDRTLRTLGRGSVFGETAILAESTRTASVVATQDCWLVVVNRETLEREIDGLKAWVGVFVRTLARRFKERDEQADLAPPSAEDLEVVPVQVANLVLMNLMTWGHHEPPDRLVLPWDRLAAELMRMTGADATELWEAIEQYAELSIDLVADRIVCTDPDGLRRRLRMELYQGG